jgi:hypothetical protein
LLTSPESRQHLPLPRANPLELLGGNTAPELETILRELPDRSNSSAGADSREGIVAEIRLDDRGWRSVSYILIS